jgi:hypothetical protein
VRNRLKLKNLHQKKLAKNNWLSYKNRKRFGASATLIPQLRKWRPMQFRNFTRLTPSQFDDLLALIKPKLEIYHSYKKPISAKTRLEITLRLFGNYYLMDLIFLSFSINSIVI